MKGSTIDMQNQNAVAPSHPKTDEKNLPKFPTPPHYQPKENVNETFNMYTENFFLWTLLFSTGTLKRI